MRAWWVVGLLLGVMWLPSVTLMIASGVDTGTGSGESGLWIQMTQGPYRAALERSVVHLICLMGLGVLMGAPLGVVLGLVRFRTRCTGLVLLAFPLVLPPFLWAIGISNLKTLVPYRWQMLFDGFPGMLWTGGVFVVPLVLWITSLIIARISGGERDAALQAGGFWCLFKVAFRFAFPVSCAAAFLGSVFVQGDTGPSQIMGYHGLSSEVLIAFASRYDMNLAIQKAIGLPLILAPGVLGAAWCLGTRFGLTTGIQVRSHGGVTIRGGRAWVLNVLWMGFVGGVVVPPVYGLMKPLYHPPIRDSLMKAWLTAQESMSTTLIYGFTASAVALMMGLGLVMATSRSSGLRVFSMVISLVFLGLSSSIHALGMVRWGSWLPVWLDAVTQSRWFVGLGLGLRFVPIAMMVCVLAQGYFGRSRMEAAEVFGVSRRLFLFRVWIPWMLPWLVVGGVMVVLLATADVSSTMMLQPPGASSFSGRLFTVMDNASAQYIASLCLVYLGMAGFGMGILAFLSGVARTRGFE